MKRIAWITLSLAGALAVLGVLNAMTPLAQAEQIAPQAQADDQPEPARQQTTAEWTINQMEFESQFPAGFAFRLDAASSVGPIVSARVEWYHRPHIRPNQPISVRRAEGDIDPATGVITAVWNATESTAVPPWVGVYYRWKLRDEAGNEFVTDQAAAEYADPGNAWTRTETDEVVVFATGLPDNMGDLVAEAMDAQRQKYLDGWGDALPYRPRVILFGDMDTWLEWQVGYQDTTDLGVVRVGVTSDAWGGTVQVLYGPADELAYGTVLHEVEHLYQQEFLSGRQSFTPGWFIEGDAVFYQLDDLFYATSYVDQVVRDNDLPVLLQGAGPTTVGESALDGYYIGYTFFKYLDDTWGITMHRKIMALLAKNVPFIDALEQATGMSITDLESAWRVSIGASPQVPTLIPTPTMPPFLPPPTPMQFGNN